MLNLKKESQFSNIIWILFLLFTIGQSLIIYLNFNSILVDADQLIIADQAKWISKGLFFEANFYGSDYMIPLDAYLSSLIIPLGFNPLTVVQFCNISFFYLPFLYLTRFFSNKFFLVRAALFFIFLLLPFKFIIVSHMARSYATIISISSISILYCLLENKNRSLILDLFLGAIFGITLGSYTATIFLTPVLIFLPKKRTFIVFLIGIFVGYFFIDILEKIFISDNLTFANNFSLSPSAFDFKRLYKFILRSDIRNVISSLLFPGLAINVILNFICRDIPILMKKKSIIAFLFLIFLIIISLMTPKPGDYTPGNPFYAIERLYMAIPYFYIICVAYIGNFYLVREKFLPLSSKNFLKNTKVILSIFSFFIFLILFNLQTSYDFIKNNKDNMMTEPAAVQIVEMPKLNKFCKVLKYKYQEKDYYFVYDGPFGRNDAGVYGCSAIFDIPITQNIAEKRGWVRNYYKSLGLIEKKFNHNEIKLYRDYLLAWESGLNIDEANPKVFFNKNNLKLVSLDEKYVGVICKRKNKSSIKVILKNKDGSFIDKPYGKAGDFAFIKANCLLSENGELEKIFLYDANKYTAYKWEINSQGVFLKSEKVSSQNIN